MADSRVVRVTPSREDGIEAVRLLKSAYLSTLTQRAWHDQTHALLKKLHEVP